MKKLMLFVFTLIAAVVFILQLKATRNNHKKDEMSTARSVTNHTTLQSQPASHLQSPNQPKLLAVPIQKTKFDRLKKEFIPWFKHDEAIKTKILHNPYFPNLFKNAEPSFGSEMQWFGYYGSKYAMFECFIDSSEFDENNEKVILIGKTRLGKNICTIKGYVTIDYIGINRENPGKPELNIRYGTIGKFHADEYQNNKKTGSFDAQWCADISEINNYQHQLEINGKDLLIAGIWKSEITDKANPFCLSGNFVEMGDEVFQVFTVGERDWSLNEPFASNGWKNYYEDEKWWLNKN